MKKVIFKVLIIIFLLLLLHIIYYNTIIGDKNISKIELYRSIYLSNMFLKSVNLYNQHISYINILYNKIKVYNGTKKVLVVLLNYREIKSFIERNYLFLTQKYHDKLLFYVTENKTLEEEYRNIKYSVIDVSNTFFKFPYKFNESKYVSIYKRRGKWNYQHMCRFFLEIFFYILRCLMLIYI